MKNILPAVKLVFASKLYVLIGILVSLILMLTYIFLGGLLSQVKGIYYFEFDLVRIITFLTLSIVAGVVVPLEIFAIRKATFSLKSSGAAGMGLLTGLTTMSCCTPLVLPLILVFFGWSVIQILEVNALIQRYLIDLSIFSIATLLISMKLAADTAISTCKVVRKEFNV